MSELVELKAKAYDTLAEIEAKQRQLAELNRRIAQLSADSERL